MSGSNAVTQGGPRGGGLVGVECPFLFEQVGFEEDHAAAKHVSSGFVDRSSQGRRVSAVSGAPRVPAPGDSRRWARSILGGRAVRYELFGLTSAELGAEWDLDRAVNHGYLPRIYLSSRPRRLLSAYVSDYLKEEVAAEGLVRNLPVFSEFLNVASLSDTELVNFSNIARDCGVSSQTIKAYFQILEDTLLGHWLPAYRKRPKRRVIGAPKFYFSDVGVVNFLARRGRLEAGSELYGKGFENWCFHELRSYAAYSESFAELSYWRLASGIEVDFVVNDMQVAIEAKSSRKILSDHLDGLRHLTKDHPRVARRVVVCLENKRRRTEDGIEILPASVFAKKLWSDEIF